MLLPLILINFIASGAVGKQNILLIIVDDLRPSLGCYGDARAYTPNIDSLAQKSILFTHAYAQQSLCAPSRNSFLTSRRPDTLKLYDFYSYWRDTVGNFVTLPEHLKNNGYTTMSIGKVFHPGPSSNGSDDYPYSFSEKPFHPYTDRYKEAPLCRTTPHAEPARNVVCPVHVSHMPNETLPDIETSQAAKSFIRKHRTDKNPFFLAVGFQKPHIPLKYPQKYLQHHPLEKFNTTNNYRWSKNVNYVAYNPWTDLRKRQDIKNLGLQFPYERIPSDYAKLIIQSYYAAVTYIDDLIGSVVKRLVAYNIRHRTTVILISDHGWSLGEHGEWAKYSNFEVALRVPVIVSIPGVTYLQPKNLTNIARVGVKQLHESNLQSKRHTSKGKNYIIATALIELVDIFPTIADIVNLPLPLCADDENYDYRNNQVILCSEGIGFLPVVYAAMSGKSIRWKKGVFSQYPRPGEVPTLIPNSDEPRLNEITIMGYTMRTRKYRYTAWYPFNHNTTRANWNITIAEELYNHEFHSRETRNLASEKVFFKIKNKLKTQMKNGWRNALPR